jgi:hypothetical protein
VRVVEGGKVGGKVGGRVGTSVTGGAARTPTARKESREAARKRMVCELDAMLLDVVYCFDEELGMKQQGYLYVTSRPC